MIKRNKRIRRKNQFTYWLKYEAEDCGIMQPPLDAQKAIDFLTNYLLGEDWYVVNPVNTQQCNTQIVFEILERYSPEFNKEMKRWSKK